MFLIVAGFVGSPLPSGNNVGNAIVAKNGVEYSFNGLYLRLASQHAHAKAAAELNQFLVAAC